MRRYPDPKPISSYIRREEKIDPKPAYQRGPVWTTKQKQLLIDSIMRDLDIPKFYLRAIKDSSFDWEIVDGQQRLRTIWGFRNGEFKLAKDADPVGEKEIAGKRYDDLDEELKDRFDSYSLDVVILDDCTLDDVEEMFVRLQNGTTLKAAEKRNALPGNMKKFIREQTAHPFFKNCGFDNKRYDYDQVAAQCMLLELNGELVNLKNTDLEKMYLENQDLNMEAPEAKKFVRVLNFLEKAFPEKTPELKKFNTISLYFLASVLLEKYASRDIAESFGQWFIDFETKRLAALGLPEDEREPEMVVYQGSTSHTTDAMESLEYRHKILSRDFFLTFPDIKQLDEERMFSNEQRLAIFRRDKGVCQLHLKCEGKKMGWDDDWHADHKVPYSKGGPTTVANGVVACADCNLAKGGE